MARSVFRELGAPTRSSENTLSMQGTVRFGGPAYPGLSRCRLGTVRFGGPAYPGLSRCRLGTVRFGGPAYPGLSRCRLG